MTVKITPNLRVRGIGQCNATIVCRDQRATLEFNETTLEKFSLDEIDQLICHELEHVIDHPQEEVLRRYLGGGTVQKAWEVANEAACDHRAATLVNAYKRKRDRHSS